jgi:Acetyltransferase (GNAT) domain
MAVYKVDPCSDPRWPQFLQQHPCASVFHTPQWLDTLKQTYKYEPILLTTSSPDVPITNGIVLCRVNSWLTGRRLVSLPFSDHCEPLGQTPDSLSEILSFAQNEVDSEHQKYVELRPAFPGSLGHSGFVATEQFCYHRVDLGFSLDRLFKNLHKTCFQQRIKRAQREGLTYEVGRGESHLERFYRLLLLTRQRHGLPPQPIHWFRNLVRNLGDGATIRLVSKAGQPIAGILTLSYKKSLLYKYGCSDAQHHRYGGMPLLLWKAIEDAHASGANEFDLGRSDRDNLGLITFKDGLGATRSSLEYFRYCARPILPGHRSWKTRVASRVLQKVPPVLLASAGQFLYKHAG